jgi:hypothetical protein
VEVCLPASYTWVTHPPSKVEVEVILRLTVSRPVCPGVRPSSGAPDHFLFLLEFVFWNITLCCLSKAIRRFGGACLVSASCWFLACLTKRNVPPKRQLTFNGIHSVISQEIELFIH